MPRESLSCNDDTQQTRSNPNYGSFFDLKDRAFLLFKPVLSRKNCKRLIFIQGLERVGPKGKSKVLFLEFDSLFVQVKMVMVLNWYGYCCTC